MKIKKTYITDDGIEFTDIKKAKIHEADLKIKAFTKAKTDRNHEQFAQYILENIDELHELLKNVKTSMRGVKE